MLHKFNKDMAFLGYNVYQVFTLFDLIHKENRQVSESIQIIESQNELIQQR